MRAENLHRVFPKSVALVAMFVGGFMLSSCSTSPQVGGCSIAPQANCQGANLAGAHLNNADLHGANLTGADLSGAHLGNANLSGADLSRTDLSKTNLGNANLSGVKSGGFTGEPNSLPSRWNSYNGYLLGPGANLSGADLSRINVPDTVKLDLHGANLSYANFTAGMVSGASAQADFSNANMEHADLTNAQMFGANFTDADMRFSHVYWTGFTNANLTGVNFIGAKLGNAYINDGLTMKDGVRTDSTTSCTNRKPGPCSGPDLSAP